MNTKNIISPERSEGYNSMQGDTKVICRIMQCPDVRPLDC